MKIRGHISIVHLYIDVKMYTPVEMFVYQVNLLSSTLALYLDLNRIPHFYYLVHIKEFREFLSIVVAQNSRKVSFIFNLSFLRILEFRFQRSLVESSHYIDEGTESCRKIQ